MEVLAAFCVKIHFESIRCPFTARKPSGEHAAGADSAVGGGWVAEVGQEGPGEKKLRVL